MVILEAPVSISKKVIDLIRKPDVLSIDSSAVTAASLMSSTSSSSDHNDAVIQPSSPVIEKVIPPLLPAVIAPSAVLASSESDLVDGAEVEVDVVLPSINASSSLTTSKMAPSLDAGRFSLMSYEIMFVTSLCRSSGLPVNRKRSASSLSNASLDSNPSSSSSCSSSLLPQGLSTTAVSRSTLPSRSPCYPGTTSLVYPLTGYQGVFSPQFISSRIIEAPDFEEENRNVAEEEEADFPPNLNSEARRNRSKHHFYCKMSNLILILLYFR